MSRTLHGIDHPSLAADEGWSRLRASDPERRLPGRNFTKACILVYRTPGGDVALKDYSGRSWIVRQLVGRPLIRREAVAYEAARGSPGLPEFLGRVDSFSLATRWVDGRPLAESPPGTVGSSVFDELEHTVDALHARGVALADLHHRDVLLTRQGAIYIVDLAMAWVLGQRPGRVRRVVFERLRDADRVAVARMRARFTGGDVAAAVEASGARAAGWHRRGRSVKRLWDRLRPRRPR